MDTAIDAKKIPASTGHFIDVFIQSRPQFVFVITGEFS